MPGTYTSAAHFNSVFFPPFNLSPICEYSRWKEIKRGSGYFWHFRQGFPTSAVWADMKYCMYSKKKGGGFLCLIESAKGHFCVQQYNYVRSVPCLPMCCASEYIFYCIMLISKPVNSLNMKEKNTTTCRIDGPKEHLGNIH